MHISYYFISYDRSLKLRCQRVSDLTSLTSAPLA